MWSFEKFLTMLSLVVSAGLLGCETQLTDPDSLDSASGSFSRAPVQVPLLEQFQDINPCSGQVVTYTFTGTARIQESADHLILVARGTVATSDGFTGTFNRQFVFIGDRVTHLRFHDVEVNSATGQRIIFGVGLAHETSTNGQPVVSFEHFSGVRCVGQTA